MQCNLNKPHAIALINSKNTTHAVRGTVSFFQRARCVLVVADIKGLPVTDSGFFGFHIHEGTMCDGTDFSNTKGHFNPLDAAHPEHAGDLPPLMLCGTNAYLAFLTDRFAVKDIIGRTVVIHNLPDDFTTQPSGNSGEKIACGIIKKP